VLHWRNVPHSLDSLNNRCGIISRTGFRLSPAAKAMIETLITVDTPSAEASLLARN
jgi:hypothetical protein